MSKRVILWFLAGWLLALIVSPKQLLGYVRGAA